MLKALKALQKPAFPDLLNYINSSLVAGIEDEEQSREAAEMLVGYKALKKETIETYDEMLSPLNKRRSVILEWKRTDMGNIEAVIEKLTARLLSYKNEQEKLREQAAAKALEIAQAQADAKRKDAVDALREDAEIVSDSNPKEARSIQQEAAALEKAPAPIVKTFDDSDLAMDSQLATVTTYSAEVIDIYLLAKAVLDREVSHLALRPNQTWLNQQARSMKEAFKVDGVEVIATQSLRRKSGVA
jgi:hypothetical protein